MKRGAITISSIGSGCIPVYIELSEDGTVWMTKNEICTLFNVYRSSVETNLKLLFKSDGQMEKTVKKEEQQASENGQKRVVEYFNLEAIIALAYRMNSYPCIQLRKWVAEQVALSSKTYPPIIVQLGTAISMN
jgi:Virulence protein